MAEIANGIAMKVLEQIGSLAYQEFCMACGVRKDLTKLECTVSAIKAVLFDAEERQASDQRLRTWLRQLKDVLNDAENVLDEFQYQVLQKEVNKRSRSTCQKVRHFFSGSNPLLFRFEMAHKIKGIRERVDDIDADKNKFNLAQRLEDRKIILLGRRDMTESFVHPQYFIGREDDKEVIMHLLMHQDAGRNVSVIPIVGIGGLGKTTLAKFVYNDERVVSNFQLRMWVNVFEDFDVTRLIKEILKSAIGSIDENLSVYMLQIDLRELLKDKKFLLVLDDVWNEDHNKWIDLKDLLIGGCNGSQIIVTTRNSLVATVMGTTPTYNLDGLSQEDCLSLFVKFAFKEGEEKQYLSLLEIGKEIVKKCKGVPLAVKTLASLLYSKVDEREWRVVRDNNIWNLEQNDAILPALKLSYNQLPFHLKQCFAYCSLFTKDYKFINHELIQIWMAHGILQATNDENIELEDVGDLYIKELCSRSFFQDVVVEGIDSYTFKMHNVIHDLALLIAKDEFLIVSKKSSIAATVCHLSFSDSVQEVTTHLEKLRKVRTIIFYTKQPVSLVEACISRFKYLRVLDLRYSSFEELSSSIGTLKYLRLLNLSDNQTIKRLPNSICKLHNLQTLLLARCHNLERLPKSIRNMISLRFFTVTTKHTYLSENGEGCLNSLRYLAIGQCEHLKSLFEGMDGCLAFLRTLTVVNCPSLTSLSLGIKDLTSLEFLIIMNCEELSLMEGEDNQHLQLSLRMLKIFNLPKLEVLPQWLQGSANTLKHLEIEKCSNFKALPEWLPRLKSLETLQIINCPQLSSLPQGMQGLIALRELKIRACPNLSRKCRQEDWPQIAHVPKIDLGE